MRRRVWVGLAALVAVVAAGAVIVFVGGDSGESRAGGEEDLRSCLSEHGVELPGAAGVAIGPPPAAGGPPDLPSSPPDGLTPAFPDDQTQEAFEACREYAPEGAPPGLPFQGG